MLIPFRKMHAQGNDFVILSHWDKEPPMVDLPRLARDICDRHFGIGADGLVLILPNAKQDATMVIFNSDGSRAEMCGSALRCVASILMQDTGKHELQIATDSGIKNATQQDGEISVNLGKARIMHEDLVVEEFSGDLVDIGNLHFVIFAKDLTDDPHLRFGAQLEHHPAFPTGVNVHFAQIRTMSEIEIKIWENAVGPTLACGTGAASVVFSGFCKGLLGQQVDVLVPGGRIKIWIKKSDDSLLLIGPVTEVFSGEFSWKI